MSRRSVLGSFISASLVALGLVGAVAAPANAASVSGCMSFEITGSEATLTDGSTCTGSVTVPGTVDSATVVAIGANAFYLNSSITAVTMPTSIATIADGAFSQASALASVNLASLTSLTFIGVSAFDRTALTSVTIPASVSFLGNQVFGYCASLRTVRFAAGSTIAEIPAIAFYLAPLTTLRLPASVAVIGGDAFAGSRFTGFSWPSSLTAIGTEAFGGSALTGVTLPAGVTYIGPNAFINSSSLAYIDLPAGLTYIGQEAFEATALQSVDIPASVTFIGNHAFDGVSTLELLTLPDAGVGTLTIGDYAFSGTSIGGGVGGDGTLTVTAAVGSIGESAFRGISTMTTLVLPATGTLAIGASAFRESAITGTLAVTPGVASVGDYAFADTPNLTGVTFPDSGSMTVGTSAFYNSAVTSAHFGAAVTSIGAYAFYAVNPLTSVTFASSGLQGIGTDAFAFTRVGDVVLPSSLTTLGDGAFRAAPNLAAFSLAGPNAHFSVAGGVLFNGDGTQLVEYPSGKAGSYEVPAISSMRDFAFYAASGLTSVTFALGTTLATVPFRAFEWSTLTSITLPSSLTTIGVRAFRQTNLSSVTIPADVTLIDDEAFRYDTPLALVQFEGAAPTFGENVFDSTSMGTVYYRPTTAGWTDALAGTLSGYTALRMMAPVYGTGSPTDTPAKVSGRAKVGRKVSAITGSWSSDLPLMVTVSWYVCGKRLASSADSLSKSAKCTRIKGKSGTKLTLSRAYKGRYIVAAVRAVNGFGSAVRYTASTTKVG